MPIERESRNGDDFFAGRFLIAKNNFALFKFLIAF